MSVLAVPQSIVLKGYKGKHTLRRDEMYRHFLKIVYNIANIVIIIKIVIIHVLILALIFCCLSALLAPHSGGGVGGLKLNPSGYAGGSVNALTFVEGFTNLYSSINAKPKIILSIIRERNMAIIINATSAIRSRMDDTNSNFCHPSTFFKNLFN